MFKFSKLLFKNSLIAIAFFAIFCSLCLTFTKQVLSEQAQKHQYTIQTISKNVTASSAEEMTKLLAQVLKNAHEYHKLSITQQGQSLFSFESNQPTPLFFIAPNSKSTSLSAAKLTIEYQLAFTNELTLIYKLIISVLLLAVVFIFLATVLNYRLQTTIFASISRQIKHDLSQVNQLEGDSQLHKQDDFLEIPALQEGIQEIRHLMSEQLKSSNNLEIEAYIDHLTGLENRNRFVQYYEEKIAQDGPVNFGALLLTRCSELQTINQVHGYHEGDKYISEVAEIMKGIVINKPGSKLFRLNSSDFATILPNEKLQLAENYAQELSDGFSRYQQTADIDSVAFTGIVFIDKTKPLGELLALADTGVSVAQTKNTNSWYTLNEGDIVNNSAMNSGNQNWRQEIDSVIEGKRISLLLQPIQPSGRNSRVYSEVLARFKNSHDELLPTASFIAMAEKLDKIVEVDRLIIDTAIQEIISKNMLEQSFGINLSARSINDEHFMIWLERKLLREPTAAPRLVFEISEFGLQQNIKTSKRLIEMLHRVGARVTVERFGVGLTSFKFFRDLTPDYIKMDSSYTRDIDDDKNNQYFLRLMVDLAHRLGINVLAESVETQEEKHTLEKLFIDGCQGFYVGKPLPL